MNAYIRCFLDFRQIVSLHMRHAMGERQVLPICAFLDAEPLSQHVTLESKYTKLFGLNVAKSALG